MNRRGFLQALGAIGAVGTVPLSARQAARGPQLSFGATPEFKARGDAFLAKAFRLFRDHWGVLGFDLPSDLAEPWVATYQRHYGFTAEDVESAFSPNWTFERGIQCMAQSSFEDGVGTWTRLEVPQGLDYAGMMGPLRLCVDRDVICERYITRFDARAKLTGPVIESDRMHWSSLGQAFNPVGFGAFTTQNRWDA